MSEVRAKQAMASLAVKIIQMPIRFYRAAISPLIGSRCRFHPTCSAYALKALETHGIVKGLCLTVRRIGKCHPYCTAEWHDPVPKQFTEQHSIGYKRRQITKQRVRKAPTK